VEPGVDQGVERGAELDRLLGLAAPLLRWRYAILTVAAYAFSFQHMRGTGRDWRYFVYGSELLLGHHRVFLSRPGGLHFYANYPNFQIGPLSLLAAAPFRVLGPGDGRVLGAIAMTAMAPLLIFVLERTAAIVWPAPSEREVAFRRATVLLGGVMVVQSWSTLATIYAHLDDVLTLSAIVFALWAVAARRPLLLGLALGIAIAAKPWGVVALPLAFALPGRARWQALATATAIACVAWGPFLLADGDTWSAMRPQVIVARSSVIHLLGVPLGDGPDWTRPVQLGLALLAGGLAVWRRRWAAVPLVGIAVRVALDPQVFLYYTAGLVLAALAWDLLRSRQTLPLWTLFAFVLLNDAYVVVDSPDARAALRLVLTVGLVIAVLAIPDRSARAVTESPRAR
jgi:hypothetical protein